MITLIPASLHPSSISVEVCDLYEQCHECDGREERVEFQGVLGWNYVMCEQVGYYVIISTSVSDLTSDEAKLSICEIAIFGQNGEI